MNIRRAHANDAPALARLVYTAAQAHYQHSGFDLTIGGSIDYQLSQLALLAVTPSPSGFHHSHFLIAEVGEDLVASAAGFERHHADSHVIAALGEIGWSDAAIARLGDTFATLFEGFPEEPVGFWTVDHVATLPEYRGLGFASKLVNRILAEGKAAGFANAKLEVFQGNPAARLYQSLGFELTETFGEALLRRWLDRDPLQRMTIAL